MCAVVLGSGLTAINGDLFGHTVLVDRVGQEVLGSVLIALPRSALALEAAGVEFP